MMKKFTLLSLLSFLMLMCFMSADAQENVTTFGIQFKPIIPSVFFRKDGFKSTEIFQDLKRNTNPTLNVDMTPRNGSSFGMVIRRGLNKRFSIESGINMITRNYTINASLSDTSITWAHDVKWITYEIPTQLLVFIRLGEKTFLNAAGGMAFNFYPSDIQSQNQESNFYQRTYRLRWWSVNLTANLGFEYRTTNAGYFYLGASYLQPFRDMALVDFRYLDANPDVRIRQPLRGNYLTLDLRYFFHEEPQATTRRKVKQYKKKIGKPNL